MIVKVLRVELKNTFKSASKSILLRFSYFRSLIHRQENLEFCFYVTFLEKPITCSLLNLRKIFNQQAHGNSKKYIRYKFPKL